MLYHGFHQGGCTKVTLKMHACELCRYMPLLASQQDLTIASRPCCVLLVCHQHCPFVTEGARHREPSLGGVKRASLRRRPCTVPGTSHTRQTFELILHRWPWGDFVLDCTAMHSHLRAADAQTAFWSCRRWCSAQFTSTRDPISAHYSHDPPACCSGIYYPSSLS